MRSASQCQNFTASQAKYPEALACDKASSTFSGGHGEGLKRSPMLTPTILRADACSLLLAAAAAAVVFLCTLNVVR